MEEKTKNSIFPSDFLWGASTASHQVEGNNHNQWTEWEHANAKKLAAEAEDKYAYLPNWRDIKTRAQDPANYISGPGVDHYNRYKEDFDLLEKLNLNSFRFSIEWSRLEPEEGVWNEAEVEHYRAYIQELKKRGIEPILNIWHWTLPVWFAKKGGFAKYKNIEYFDRFVKKIAYEYSAELNWIITLNEPNVYVTHSYLSGDWPPGVGRPVRAAAVYWNLVTVHKRAYKILKKHKGSLRIGVASQLANVQAKRPHNLIDVSVTKIMRYAWNWWFLDRIRHFQDFVGINYYFSDYYKGIKADNPSMPKSDLGWYMEPEGLYPLLLRINSHYKKPIIISENGLADSTDEYRRWWIEETIVAMERALSEGVELRGYFHWSLLDNFEWAYGWWPKFGLVQVDRERGMKRIIRPSAKWLADKIKDFS